MPEKIVIQTKSCHDCFRPVYLVNTAMGPMVRCDRCAVDWFPDETIEIDLEPEAESPDAD